MPRSKQLSDPVAALVPFRESFTADIELLLRAPRLTSLMDALDQNLDLVAAPEPSNSRIKDLAETLEADADIVFAALRLIPWLCSAAREVETEKIVSDLKEGGFIGGEDEAALGEVATRIVKNLTIAFDRRARLSAIMQTFRKVSYACNLRLWSAEEASLVQNKSSGLPVSIIRIVGDESEPFVFQCTVADLDRLIEVLGDARKLLTNSG